MWFVECPGCGSKYNPRTVERCPLCSDREEVKQLRKQNPNYRSFVFRKYVSKLNEKYGRQTFGKIKRYKALRVCVQSISRTLGITKSDVKKTIKFMLSLANKN
jgi:hypothetical protein